MAEKKTRILLRSDISSAWLSANPTLLKGEVGIEYNPTVTGNERVIKFKIGDGATAWNDLGYVADYDSVVAALRADITRLDGADTVEGSVAKKIKVAIDQLSADIATTYQEKLPEVTEDKYNKYLHTNTTTGALEWVYVEQGAANWGSISGSINAQEDLIAEFAKKVDKVEGKGLSTNDYTDADKEKLAAIEAGAQENVIEEIQVDGVKVAPADKVVNIVGLAKAADVEDLERRVEALETAIALKANAADVYTKSEVYTKAETEGKIAAAIAGIKHWTYKVVQTLPTPSADCEHIIYLVPKGSGKTGYKEYVCINEGATEAPAWKFEEIGDTDIDLSNYYTKDETYSKEEVNTKVTTLEAADTALGNRIKDFEDNNTNYDNAATKAHEHINKAELDLIKTGDVAKWNAKQDALTAEGGVVISNNVVKLADDLILNGGSASDFNA